MVFSHLPTMCCVLLAQVVKTENQAAIILQTLQTKAKNAESPDVAKEMEQIGA